MYLKDLEGKASLIYEWLNVINYDKLPPTSMNEKVSEVICLVSIALGIARVDVKIS